MFALPLSATLISLACAIVAGRRYWARHRPHELCWSLSFSFFALGAGAATLGYLVGWTPLLVRLFYASGAILTTAYLGLGSLYLLVGKRLERWGPGIMLGMTTLAFAFVFSTDVDSSRLGEAWYALKTAGSPTRILAVLSNSIGATIVVVGALYSVSQGFRRAMPRNRAIGVLLIAAGTLVVASGTSLIKLFGNSAYLFVAMAPGVAIIMAGYLLANHAPGAAAVPALVGVASTLFTAPATAVNGTAAVARPPTSIPSATLRPATTSVPTTPLPVPARHRTKATAPATTATAVRLLSIADLAAVRAVLAATCTPAPLAVGIRYLRDDVLAADLARSDAHWFGAECGGTLVAVARAVAGSDPATRHTAHLGPFAVLTEQRDTGAAETLLTEVLQWADDHLALVRLDTWAWPDDEPTLALLAAHGFAHEGTMHAALFANGQHRSVASLARIAQR